MDLTLYLFLEVLAFFFFIYGIERDTWHGLLIFLSVTFFFALSLASFNLEQNYVVADAVLTKSSYDETFGYLNSGMGLISLAIGFIRTLSYKESLKVGD
jgi:hypothetical protein